MPFYRLPPPPQVKLDRVPTLYRWGRSGPVGWLVEDQCKSTALLSELTE
jgi:hypothetical protein